MAQIIAQPITTTNAGFWDWLKQSIDFMRSCPKQIDGVTVSEFQGKHGLYYVLRSPRGEYLKLSPQHYFLFTQMNGQRTVTDIVMAYFAKYKAFATGQLKALLPALRDKGFLTEPSVHLYQKLYLQLHKGGIASVGTRIMRSFMQREFNINNIDGLVTWAYHHGVKWLFSKPALVLWGVTVIVGTILFARQILANSYGLVQTGNSFGPGFVLLIIASLFAIFLHECGHAFTTKHFGRQVKRGGFMIYFGMPAFFVNTMDIWMADKKARIAVSGAGPFVNLIVGSICGIILTFAPTFAGNDLFFKLGAMAYLGAILNLNPLIELDGYFILMDGLEIPSLRQRALGFVRRSLGSKLRRREKLSSDERIFTIFGFMAGLYTIYVVVLSVYLWKEHFVRLVTSLWESPGWLPKVVVGFVVLVTVVPLAVSVALRLYQLVRKVLHWVVTRVLFASQRKMALLFLAAIALVNGIPWLVASGQPATRDTLIVFSHLLILLTGLGTLGAMAAHYDRSQMQRGFLALSVSSLLFLAAEVSIWISPPLVLWLRWAGTICLPLVAFIAFDSNDLHLSTRLERWILASVLLVGAITSVGISAITVARGMEVIPAMANGLAVFAGSLTLSLLTPLLGALFGTGFGIAWSFIGLGAIGLAGSSALAGLGLIPVELQNLSWGISLGLIVAGVLQAYLTRGGLPYRMPPASEELGLNDQDRLYSAVEQIVALLVSQYRGLFGERRARELEEHLNVLSLSAHWAVTLDRSHLIAAYRYQETPILQLAQTLHDMLDHLVRTLEDLGGQGFTRAALQQAYDGLRWEQREILGAYILQHTSWGATLSRQFSELHQDHRSLLQSIPLFAHCSEAELEGIVARLSERHYPARAMLIRQGEVGKEFFIVKRGMVVVWQQDQDGFEERVNQHGRGGVFGEVALLKDAPRNATCVAATPVDVLILKRGDFDVLVRHYFELGAKVDQAIQSTQLLRKLPLFAETSTDQLKEIAARLVEIQVPAETTIFRQGDPGDRFYIIEEGEVEVRQEQEDGQQPVVRRGPGEYFGEIALLRDIPRTATLVAVTDCRLLTLSRADFLILIQQENVQREIERVGSRRLLDMGHEGRQIATPA